MRLPRRWLPLFAAAAIAAPAPAVAAPAGAAVALRADSNRDGTVDLAGASDEADKGAATLTAGALFLPNLDDDARRCAARDESCADAADAVVNGEADALDLAPLRTTPAPAVGGAATATVAVQGAAARHTRLFAQRAGGWGEVTAGTTFTAEDLRRGLVLGLEGRDIVRDAAAWDGTAKVTLTVSDGGTSTDSVALRLAPMLAHAHTQATWQLAAAPTNQGAFPTFRRDLERAASNAKVPRGVHFFAVNDIWAQDWFEPMWASMPAPGGARQLRLLLRSDQARDAQKALYALRGPDVGVVKLAGVSAAPRRPNTFNSFGNLEAIPPYRNGARDFPAGRIVQGEDPGGEGPSATTRRVLAAQGAQPPLMLDSGWLRVGHVDEFLSFLPVSGGRGWKLGIADPRGAVALLRRAADAGSGGVALSSHRDFRRMTISGFLADRRLTADQEAAAKKIDANLARLVAEIGLADTEVVRIPTLYVTESGGRAAGPGAALTRDRLLAADPGLRDRLAAATPAQRDRLLRRGAMGALLPAAINSIVVTPGRVIAPKQWGPVIGGKDILAEAVTQAYAGAGLTVEFVDDYTTYHVGKGEVHCASNSLRDMPAQWWKLP